MSTEDQTDKVSAAAQDQEQTTSSKNPEAMQKENGAG